MYNNETDECRATVFFETGQRITNRGYLLAGKMVKKRKRKKITRNNRSRSDVRSFDRKHSFDSYSFVRFDVRQTNCKRKLTNLDPRRRRPVVLPKTGRVRSLERSSRVSFATSTKIKHFIIHTAFTRAYEKFLYTGFECTPRTK